MEQISFLENRLFPILLAIIGLGILGIWIKDIASGKFSGQGHFFKWVEGEDKHLAEGNYRKITIKHGNYNNRVQLRV
ncbi:MAG: hypothetical protein K9H26_00185 [Prolixibacteraceae bacterium]|nr:hypothetical protein [Prolixibacteraceae bacterium]